MKITVVSDQTQPFAICEETTLSHKSKKCSICNKKIFKDEIIMRYQLFNWASDVYFFAHQNCFKKSSYFKNYQEKFLTNCYDIKVFSDFPYMFHDCYKSILKSFDFDKALNLIVKPPLKHRPLYNENCRKNLFSNVYPVFPSENYDQVLSLLSILIKCGYKDELLRRMEKMPKHTWMLLAMHEERKFQEKVSELFNIPKLPQALEILRKRRLNLNDMLLISETGKDNPVFLKILSETIERYELDYIRTSAYGYESFREGRNVKLCYFFISDPAVLPVFDYYLKTSHFQNLKGEFSYMKGFYYRATVFYHMLYNPKDLNKWLNEMETCIKYFPSGSPKGFINDTKKMVEKYRKVSK